VRQQYYQDVLLMQELLPMIARDVLVFHQDNAPAHHAHDTVELLCCETPQFISSVATNGREVNLRLITASGT